MTKEHLNRIAELRRAKGLSQAALADKLGIHTITLSKLERGKIQLHTGYIDAIAEALGVPAGAILASNPVTREITIAGAIQSNGHLDAFTDEDGDTEEFEIEVLERPISEGVGAWVIVEGDSCWPLYHDQDKLYFVPIVEDDLGQFEGRLSIVFDRENTGRVGFLLRASMQDGADLQPINGRVLKGLPISHAWILSDVRFSFPREFLTMPYRDAVGRRKGNLAD